MEINWNQLDEKWRCKWHEAKDFETNPNEKPKKFITVAYPYPNSPQHIGTWTNIHTSRCSCKILQNERVQCIIPNGISLHWDSGSRNGKKNSSRRKRNT